MSDNIQDFNFLQGVKAHEIALRIVQHEPETVEAGDAAQESHQIAEQARQVPVRGGGARDIEQDPVDIARGACAGCAVAPVSAAGGGNC